MIRYASEFDHSGYAVAARRYVRALIAAGVSLHWDPLVNTHDGRVLTDRSTAASSALRDLAAQPRLPQGFEAEATIAHCMPMSWRRLFDELPSRRRIGQTVWETETVPTRWHRELDPADELWVPTRWNADTLRRGGWAKPLQVVPHIVDLAPTAPPPLDLPDDVTVFVTIAAWEQRKRPDLTVEAFLRAFTTDDPVVLVVKTGPRVQSWFTASAAERATWWQVMQLVKQHSRPAGVHLVTEVWTDEHMAGLVDRADAYITLTATEGWGLGAFDAATRGVPVVITGWGGQREWLADDAPFVVPYQVVPADHPDRSMFEPGMTWAAADVDAAAAMLRAIHLDRGAARRASAPMATRLQRQYSPEAVGSLMREVLG